MTFGIDKRCQGQNYSHKTFLAFTKAQYACVQMHVLGAGHHNILIWTFEMAINAQ